MKLIKCEHNHMYDADKFGLCPHCSNRRAEPELEFSSSQAGIATYKPEDTINPLLLRKVVGCFICIEGEMKGEGFWIKEGINYIGRATNMEISLSRETTVSREKHASITYEEDSHIFELQDLKNAEDIAYNGKKVTRSCRLKSRAIIQIGACQLLFLPVCDHSFSWDA